MLGNQLFRAAVAVDEAKNKLRALDYGNANEDLLDLFTTTKRSYPWLVHRYIDLRLMRPLATHEATLNHVERLATAHDLADRVLLLSDWCVLAAGESPELDAGGNLITALHR